MPHWPIAVRCGSESRPAPAGSSHCAMPTAQVFQIGQFPSSVNHIVSDHAVEIVNVVVSIEVFAIR